MRNRLGVLLCSLALLQVLGGHWAFLQTGAWIGMMVRYSCEAGLQTGVSETFDGEHPCVVCKIIQDGQKREQNKAPQLNSEYKKDYLSASENFHIHSGWGEVNFFGDQQQMQGVAFEPDVPPPRS